MSPHDQQADNQPARENLLGRLDAIGCSLADSGRALALIGLGSVGVELDRLDGFSDLDFFAIVRPGAKGEFLNRLDWLSRICPLAYHFHNTVDGYKVLFKDGIYAEFAVFEPDELQGIPFTAGRIVWKAEGVDENIRYPAPRPVEPKSVSDEFLIGEALTCLYTGLNRYRRGEKLSAQRLIEHFAVDRVLELIRKSKPPTPHEDPFAGERRLEQRYPDLAPLLPAFIQGYERTPKSAQAILEYLDRNYTINQAIKMRIIALYSE